MVKDLNPELFLTSAAQEEKIYSRVISDMLFNSPTVTEYAEQPVRCLVTRFPLGYTQLWDSCVYEKDQKRVERKW